VKKSDDHIISAAPWLKDRSFADAQIVRIRSRDGVPIEALVTLPLGATKENPPLVVLVHGGPWVRDLWAFNPVVQLLASRGYAVLQPGYRGSAGFSATVSDAGRFEFRHMVDDVADATHGVQKSGLVDPTRAAVMGSGFGGTLALAAAEAEPDLFRCVVSAAGVFDWEELIRDLRSDGHPGEYESVRDNPATFQAAFNAIAPLAHVADIHGPVFFAHGTDDTGGSRSQAKALVAAFEKQGVAHETFFRGLKAGGFYGNVDRIELYRQVDAFLGKNLPAAP